MSIVVSELIANAKVHADTPLNVDDTAGWLVFANRSVLSAWRSLTIADPWSYFAQGDFSLTASTAGAVKDLSTLTWNDSAGVALSPQTGFKILHGVDIRPDTSSRASIRRRSFHERNQTAIAWWEPAPLAQDRAYDLRGRQLVITPFENAGGTYRVYATLAPYKFTGTSDTQPLDWQLEDWAEYIELRMAMRALRIEESDTSNDLARDAADVKAELIESAQRDDGEGYIIGDVEDF